MKLGIHLVDKKSEKMFLSGEQARLDTWFRRSTSVAQWGEVGNGMK